MKFTLDCSWPFSGFCAVNINFLDLRFDPSYTFILRTKTTELVFFSSSLHQFLLVNGKRYTLIQNSDKHKEVKFSGFYCPVHLPLPPSSWLPPPWLHLQVPHPGHKTCCLCPHKRRTERPAVLPQHLAHPGVSDGPPRLPGEVQHPGLCNSPDDPVQVHGDIPPVADHHLEEVPQALQPLLANRVVLIVKLLIVLSSQF